MAESRRVRREVVQRLRHFPEIRASVVNATTEISDVGNAIISEKTPLGMVYYQRMIKGKLAYRVGAALYFEFSMLQKIQRCAVFMVHSFTCDE